MTFSLILTTESNPQDIEILNQEVKANTIPRIGENVAYNGAKFKVIRVVHDFNSEQQKILVFVQPNFITQQPSNQMKQNNDLDFYDLYM